MTFRTKRHLRFSPVAINGQFKKVRNFCRQARAEQCYRFLGIFRASLSTVDQLCARTIGELNLGSDAVREWKTPTGRRSRLRKNASRFAEQVTEVIQEMTNLADHAATAFGEVRVPVIWFQPSCNNSISHGFGSCDAGELGTQDRARGRKPTVESHL